MLYDYVHVEDYQEEPDDEEAHIEQGETKPNPNSPCPNLTMKSDQTWTQRRVERKVERNVTGIQYMKLLTNGDG